MDAHTAEQHLLDTFEISEVRLNEADTAVAFLGQTEGRGTWSLKHNLSILARHEGKIVGAALFFDAATGRPSLEVAVKLEPNDTDDERPEQLANLLVDKALLKLHAARCGRFAIRVAGKTNPGRFWQHASWLGKNKPQPRQTPAEEISTDDPAETVAPTDTTADTDNPTETNPVDQPQTVQAEG
ncbi:hypothetical protein [Mucisphaera sp.]|uniref:hypothetical protein n=1 Tax=Mucisphaera sp. TaxID=2913024 RepID=UPI003D0E5452